VVFRWGVSNTAQEEEGRLRRDTRARERDKEKPGWEATLKAERPSVDQPKRVGGRRPRHQIIDKFYANVNLLLG
jgi:hypothetical protein